MAGQGPPSEFGGRVDKRGFQPHPHRLDPSEELRDGYRGGSPTGERSLTFEGLLPIDETIAKRKSGELPGGWTEPSGLWDEWVEG